MRTIFDRPDFSLIVRRKLAKSTCESQRCFDSKPNKRKKKLAVSSFNRDIAQSARAKRLMINSNFCFCSK